MGKESPHQKATASSLATGNKEQGNTGKQDKNTIENGTIERQPWHRWKCLRPSILSLIIPLSYVFLVVFIFSWSSDEQWLRAPLLFLSILLLLLWFLFSYLLFPRIVVTIMDIDNIKQFYLWADGKEIYKCKEAAPAPLPIQFSFQVWRRGKYDLCLKVENGNRKIEPITKQANTYEHTICHVTFPKEDKRQGKNKGD